VSAVTDEELGPKLTFEIADLLRERRSSKVKPLCGPTEMQFLGDGDEVGQLSELHAVDGRAGADRRGLPHRGHKSWTHDEDER
jgi:hypothetical protein